MGSVVLKYNKELYSILSVCDELSLCAQAQFLIDGINKTITSMSTMVFISPALIRDYIDQVEECARYVDELKKLECQNTVFLELRSECLKKFSAFEADMAGDPFIIHKESARAFKA
ncbi:hypothetical protein JK176_13030 [Gluconobacter sp. Dm-73]|uniref:hypothetical protein n=1 Tax=Gluconobacter sp. Dm-73 TaxID=2799802 RepID=UPI001B8CAF04|nr:hypothetical protein [Gluconobacter sp. Dm-73]MBS1075804.1 hypothetical protein [Gluconobacter sp. Dm-73]